MLVITTTDCFLLVVQSHGDERIRHAMQPRSERDSCLFRYLSSEQHNGNIVYRLIAQRGLDENICALGYRKASNNTGPWDGTVALVRHSDQRDLQRWWLIPAERYHGQPCYAERPQEQQQQHQQQQLRYQQQQDQQQQGWQEEQEQQGMCAMLLHQQAQVQPTGRTHQPNLQATCQPQLLPGMQSSS